MRIVDFGMEEGIFLTAEIAEIAERETWIWILCALCVLCGSSHLVASGGRRVVCDGHRRAATVGVLRHSRSERIQSPDFHFIQIPSSICVYPRSSAVKFLLFEQASSRRRSSDAAVFRDGEGGTVFITAPEAAVDEAHSRIMNGRAEMCAKCLLTRWQP